MDAKGINFEWDERKAEENFFETWCRICRSGNRAGDPLSITIPDSAHSASEDRFVTLGMSIRRRLLVMIHTERGNRFRIITARRATPRERRDYEEGKI